MGGFVLQSRGMPGIRKITSQPKFEQTPVDDASATDVRRVRTIQDQIKFSTITIGPVAPTSLEPRFLIDNLISLKHQSVSLGWIFGPGVDGIVQSLDVKLNAAKDSIAAGHNKTAANQLNAFIHELEAQRGKHLNDNAFFLLQANAQFIIAKLGGS